MIDALVERDIDTLVYCTEEDYQSFLEDVLRGDGWVPYNQLTDEQVRETYEDMVLNQQALEEEGDDE
jgi:hypothetical protein